MNSRALRRLAADHGALHNELPPNFLFPAGAATDNLTQLDILLAGPTFTPFALGVWKLHLTIPPNYPQQPPTATFRTPIFHPNVDPQTGGVCVETLKRDWDSRLTLRDVLITISCLLIQPNPDSALNAEAGALIHEDYEAFARRAELMTSIHAVVPHAMRAAVQEAQNRGQESNEEDEENNDAAQISKAPVRRRRTIAKVREGMRRAETTPTGPAARRRQLAAQAGSLVYQARNDDVFGSQAPPQRTQAMEQVEEGDDEEMVDAEQENNSSNSPTKAGSPMAAMTPRRPRGIAVPLGELIMDQDEDTSEEMEREYPPSPRKSPSKSPVKRKQTQTYDSNASIPESSRDAALRAPNITPPNLTDSPLADDSTFMDVTFQGSISPRRKGRGLFQASAKRPPGALQLGYATPEKRKGLGIQKQKSPSSAERRRKEDEKRASLDAKLWASCGEDIRRWNRGDFDGEPFKRKAARW
ncbi:Hypothetical predicted protein [Lecanosticta acicola]|uniref:Ubiquitin-conjugating enzyme E2 2 n=1 Tax=Lecanosticta acicola TaxID=111012 RepID=A0AAI8Z5H0_9PEZI|nr:Hypothetical predicted protein [Lecanosticta acicola]